MKTTQHVDIEGRSLALSKLDKVLYPSNGFTKAQVIDYYIRTTPWLLPHFLKRPITMKRFPDGVQRQGVLREGLVVADGRLVLE